MCLIYLLKFILAFPIGGKIKKTCVQTYLIKMVATNKYLKGKGAKLYFSF